MKLEIKTSTVSLSLTTFHLPSYISLAIMLPVTSYKDIYNVLIDNEHVLVNTWINKVMMLYN